MAPAQHDHHTLVLDATTGPGWLWVVVLAGVLTVSAAALLRTVLPAAVRRAEPVLGAVAFGVGLLVLLLAPGTLLPRPVVGAAVLTTAVAVGCHLAGSRRPAGSPPPAWSVPLRLLALPVALAAAVGAVAVPAVTWAVGTTDLGPAVSSGLFAGALGLAWLALSDPRSRAVTVLAHVSGWVLAHAVLGASTVAAIAALPA